MSEFDLGRGVHGIDRAMREVMADAGGVDSVEMKETAKTLAGSIRKTLRGQKGTPSAPGDPPAQQSGKLAGSVRDGVLGAARWVGPTSFTAPMLERGTKGRQTFASRVFKGRVEKRPFMERSLEAVQDEMADVMVSGIQDRKGL